MEIERSAVISDDGLYRYILERRWDEGEAALFVMLNPSTADAEKDDATIRRCVGFARRWGYGALLVGNLYAYRATDPSELDVVEDPIGRENNDYLWHLIRRAGVIVAAWGANPNRGKYVNRERSILWGPLSERAFCFGTTKDGHPRHPLRIRADTPLQPYGLSA